MPTTLAPVSRANVIAIAPDPVPFDVLLRYVRKPTGEMPPYTAKVVSDQELADIYAYLQSRPHPPTAKASQLLK